MGYLAFVTFSALAVLSPGPGVVLTLTNAVRYDFRRTLGGILGLATGAFVLAALSATGVGLVLAASARAFAVLKLAGAAYLCFLGIRLWTAPPGAAVAEGAGEGGGFGRRYLEGLTLQLTNPKAIVFFVAVLPQFVDPASSSSAWLLGLATTYATLVVTIHVAYAALARSVRTWLASPAGGRLMNRAGGVTFLGFGLALARASR